MIFFVRGRGAENIKKKKEKTDKENDWKMMRKNTEKVDNIV